MEVWKDVIGYENSYEISNIGIVRSKDRLGTDGRKLKGQILSNRLHSSGYLRVMLYKNEMRKDKYIHRLVAEAFVLNPSNLPQVNHKDGNKKNNRVDNLEWIDGFGNMQHAWDNGLMKNTSKNLTLKCGKNCSLIDIKTKQLLEFETREKLSMFLGYNPYWLSKAVSANTDYSKACLKKGYIIHLDKGD